MMEDPFRSRRLQPMRIAEQLQGALSAAMLLGLEGALTFRPEAPDMRPWQLRPVVEKTGPQQVGQHDTAAASVVAFACQQL